MNTAVMFSSKRMDWSTPQSLFDKLNNEFHFTLDPCATDENAKCERYYTKHENGLNQNWEGESVFCNPPYGRELPMWIKKCYHEGQKDDTTVVMLIPARTDTKAFHEYIYNKSEIRFIKGRLKFGGEKNSAPFPSMIVIYRGGGEAGATYEKHKWHKIPEEKPTEEVQYLCCTMYGGKPYFKVMNWSNNLFKIDIYDFYDCKGKSGFYEHDSEYGYLEGYCDFWKPIEWGDEDDE